MSSRCKAYSPLQDLFQVLICAEWRDHKYLDVAFRVILELLSHVNIHGLMLNSPER